MADGYGFNLSSLGSDPLGVGSTVTYTNNYYNYGSNKAKDGSNGGFWGDFSIGDVGKWGLGLYSILNERNNQKDAISLGKANLQFSKDQAAANYLQNATGWANQQLWNAQAMYNFDPAQGAKYANSLQGSFENLNNAGAKLGLSGALDNQLNSLSQYTQLKDNAQG